MIFKRIRMFLLVIVSPCFPFAFLFWFSFQGISVYFAMKGIGPSIFSSYIIPLYFVSFLLCLLDTSLLYFLGKKYGGMPIAIALILPIIYLLVPVGFPACPIPTLGQLGLMFVPPDSPSIYFYRMIGCWIAWLLWQALILLIIQWGCWVFHSSKKA